MSYSFFKLSFFKDFFQKLIHFESCVTAIRPREAHFLATCEAFLKTKRG